MSEKSKEPKGPIPHPEQDEQLKDAPDAGEGEKNSATVDMVSIFPRHGITIKGPDLPRAIVDGKVVFGQRKNGWRVQFDENIASVPSDWMEFTSTTTGLPAGLKHTLGYRIEFVEREELLQGLKDRKGWAKDFLNRVNTRRIIGTPQLEPLDVLDLLGIRAQGAQKPK